jgi:hypothetical protein
LATATRTVQSRSASRLASAVRKVSGSTLARACSAPPRIPGTELDTRSSSRSTCSRVTSAASAVIDSWRSVGSEDESVTIFVSTGTAPESRIALNDRTA